MSRPLSRMAEATAARLRSDELEALMSDLANWAPAMTQVAARELADRVLLACGWVCETIDDSRWWRPVGADRGWLARFLNGHQPNPIVRLDDALAMLPDGWLVTEMRLLDQPRLWVAAAVKLGDGRRLHPMHICLSIAVCSAAVLAWAEEGQGA